MCVCVSRPTTSMVRHTPPKCSRSGFYVRRVQFPTQASQQLWRAVPCDQKHLLGAHWRRVARTKVCPRGRVPAPLLCPSAEGTFCSCFLSSACAPICPCTRRDTSTIFATMGMSLGVCVLLLRCWPGSPATRHILHISENVREYTQTETHTRATDATKLADEVTSRRVRLMCNLLSRT